ncbi:MAG: hypothetical protein P1V97_13215 [Planctomycetota bacterium]|nr:hypothetical protein [Planctomycetota bacterium]
MADSGKNGARRSKSSASSKADSGAKHGHMDPAIKRQIKFPIPRNFNKSSKSRSTSSRSADEVQVIRNDGVLPPSVPKPRKRVRDDFLEDDDDSDDTQVASMNTVEKVENPTGIKNMSFPSAESAPRGGNSGDDQALWKARQAIELFERGKVGKAMILVQRGLSKTARPDAQALFLSLDGYRSLVKGDPATALSTLQRSVELLENCAELEDHEKADVYYRLADVCEQLRNVVEGLKAISACVDLLVEVEDSIRLRRAVAAKGRLHYLMRQYEESYQAFEMALSCEGAEPEAWKLHHGIAKCYDKLGLKDEAKRAYEASRRSVMNKARNQFGKLMDDSGQASEEELKGESKEEAPATIAAPTIGVIEEAPTPTILPPTEEITAPTTLSDQIIEESTTAVITPKVPLVGGRPSESVPTARISTLPVAEELSQSKTMDLTKIEKRDRAPVSEAYPRDKLFDLIKTPETPSREDSGELFTEALGVFDEEEVSQKTVTIETPNSVATQQLSPSEMPTPNRPLVVAPRVSRSYVTYLTFIAIPGIILSFLFGLWFGHSGLSTQLEQAKSDKDAFSTELGQIKQKTDLAGVALETSIADAELRANRPGYAAVWAAKAYATLTAFKNDSKFAARRDKAGSLAEMAFLKGPWSWHTIASVHKGPIRQITVSACGNFVLSRDDTGSIKAWSVLTGEKVELPLKAGAFAEGVVFSPDGRILAGLSKDKGYLSFYDWGGKKSFVQENLSPNYTALVFSKLGERCASLSKSNKIQVWSPFTGNILSPEFAHPSPVIGYCFSEDGRFLTSLCQDKTLRVWDPSGKTVFAIKKAHEKTISAFAADQNGQELVSASEDGQLCFWKMKDGKLTPGSKIWLDQKKVQSLALYRGEVGRLLAVACTNGEVILYKGTTPLTTFQGSAASVNALSFLPNGRGLLTGSEDKQLRLWRFDPVLPAKKQSYVVKARQWTMSYSKNTLIAILGSNESLSLHKVTATGLKPYAGALKKELSNVTGGNQGLIALSTNQRYLALAQSNNTVTLWNLEKGQKESSFTVKKTLTAIAIPSSSKQVVLGTNEGELLVVNFQGMVLRRSRREKGSAEGAVQRLLVGHRSSYVLAVFKNGAVKLWNTTRDQALQQLVGGAKTAPAIAFSHDDSTIAVSVENSLRFWSLSKSGELVQKGKNKPLSTTASQLAFSPDGKALALARGNEIEVRSLESGDIVYQLQGVTKLSSLSFVYGPKLLLTHEDGSIHLRALSGPSFSRNLFEKDPVAYIRASVGLEVKAGVVHKSY